MGLCHDVCKSWYLACANDYFVAPAPRELHPCTDYHLKKSYVCFPLNEITHDYQDFCNHIGYTVSDSDCYDNVPSAITKGKLPVASTSEKEKPKKSKTERNQERMKKKREDNEEKKLKNFSLWDTYHVYTRNLPKWASFLLLLVIIAVATFTLTAIFGFIKGKFQKKKWKSNAERNRIMRRRKFEKESEELEETYKKHKGGMKKVGEGRISKKKDKKAANKQKNENKKKNKDNNYNYK